MFSAKSRVRSSLAIFAASASLALAFTVAARAQQAQPVKVETGNPDVQIEIVELKRSEDGFLTLRATVQNKSGGSLYLNDIASTPLRGVMIQDNVNRRRHLVVMDSGGACLCSGEDAVPNGQTRRIWAKFATPPQGVGRVDVYFGRLEPVSNVPITN